MPEDELRKILGENAIMFYNLDRGPLDAAGIALDERVLTHFNQRSG